MLTMGEVSVLAWGVSLGHAGLVCVVAEASAQLFSSQVYLVLLSINMPFPSSIGHFSDRFQGR
jgi:hypothetical protein